MNNYKRLFQAIKGKYRYLIFSVVMVLVVQAVAFVSPLLIKSILDDCLLGVEHEWVQVDGSAAETVFRNGKYYKQVKSLQDGETAMSPASVVIYKGAIYFADARVPAGERTLSDDGILTVDGNGYPVEKLSADEVMAFYRPVYPVLLRMILLFFALTVLSILCNYLGEVSNNRVRTFLPMYGRTKGMEAAERLPIGYFEAEPAGKIATRISQDVDGLIALYRQMTMLLLPAILSFVLAYVGMFVLDAKLALLSFLAYPVIVLWIMLYLKRLKKISENFNETRSVLTAKTNEIINGIQILQAFNFKEGTLKDYNKYNDAYRKYELQDVKLSISVGWNMLHIIRGVITTVIVAYFGLQYRSVSGVVVTAGVIYAYNEYLLKLVNPIQIALNQISEFEHAHVRCGRWGKLVEHEREDDDKEPLPRYRGDVRFDNVWFGYVPDTYVLKGVSLDIKAGSTVGIVGHTGSGKSTLMNLLLRFYDITDPVSGKIYVDGTDICTHSKRSYREHIGIVLQEPVMFKGTIASNIRFGREDISDETVEQVLRSIGGGPIIDKFEDGIRQKVSRYGTNLSAGERQMLSLARAIVYDPAILIMDEATSHIDVETEEMIKNALKVVSKGRTMIIIAHRISTVFNADNIIVLDHGQKVEEGDHEALMKRNGKYAAIYRAQLAGNGSH